MPFELLSHTADVRVQLKGVGRDGLAMAAAEMARAVLVGDCPVRPLEQRALDIDTWLPPEERFFRFLRELFFLADAEGFLPAEAEPVALGWTLRGEHFDPARHCPRYQVKAVTRHGYRYRCRDSACRVELVLDL